MWPIDGAFGLQNKDVVGFFLSYERHRPFSQDRSKSRQVGLLAALASRQKYRK